jgi:hypothetical protein
LQPTKPDILVRRKSSKTYSTRIGEFLGTFVAIKGHPSFNKR